MTLPVTGALLGTLIAIGLLMAVLFSPPLRKRSLSDRIAPYLTDAEAPSRLLLTDAKARGGIVHRLAEPLVRDLVSRLDKFVGGQASVARRLAALGSTATVEQFRSEQVLWGAAGAGIALGIGALAVLGGQRNVLLIFLLIVGCIVAGVLARDWWLGRAVAKRHADMLSEFPVVADILALAVTAGEGPLDAISRICRSAKGRLVDELAGLVAETRSGTPFVEAVVRLRDRTQLEPLARFLDGISVAVDRGTPLADVLRAQAADVRALGRRQLLEAGGRKEIAMMLPVVFIVMPVTILFALYPGLVAITSVAG